jgi:hypothetical protein
MSMWKKLVAVVGALSLAVVVAPAAQAYDEIYDQSITSIEYRSGSDLEVGNTVTVDVTLGDSRYAYGLIVRTSGACSFDGTEGSYGWPPETRADQTASPGDFTVAVVDGAVRISYDVTLDSGGTCTTEARVGSGQTSYPTSENTYGNSTGYSTLTFDTQALSWSSAPPASVDVGDSFTVSVNNADSAAVGLNFSASGACSVDSSSTSSWPYSYVISADSVGDCSLSASWVAKSGWSDSLSATTAVDKLAQTISWGAYDARVASGSTFPTTATASSGLTVSYSSTCGDPWDSLSTDDGSCSITASQAGNSTYSAVSDTIEIVVTAEQVMTFDLASSYTLNTGTVDVAPSTRKFSSTSLTYSSADTSVCTASGSSVSLVSTGTCSITVTSLAGGANNYILEGSEVISFTVAANPAPPSSGGGSGGSSGGSSSGGDTETPASEDTDSVDDSSDSNTPTPDPDPVGETVTVNDGEAAVVEEGDTVKVAEPVAGTAFEVVNNTPEELWIVEEKVSYQGVSCEDGCSIPPGATVELVVASEDFSETTLKTAVVVEDGGTANVEAGDVVRVETPKVGTVFQVKNTSSKSLRIVDKTVSYKGESCSAGCSIAPGETVELAVNSDDFSGTVTPKASDEPFLIKGKRKSSSIGNASARNNLKVYLESLKSEKLTVVVPVMNSEFKSDKKARKIANRRAVRVERFLNKRGYSDKLDVEVVVVSEKKANRKYGLDTGAHRIALIPELEKQRDE